MFALYTPPHLLQYSENNKSVVDESVIIGTILKKRKSRGLLIDVGACVGGVTKHYAQMGWDVLAFEPDPDNFVKLSHAVRRYKQVKTFKLAISNQDDDEIAFYASKQSAGVSSLAAFTATHEKRCTVKTRTLASILKELQIEKIHFLKIDAEGYDNVVLHSFDWNRKCEFFPTAILCEFDNKKELPSELGYTMKNMAGFLHEKGYEIYISEWYPIKQYGKGHAFKCLKKYPCEVSEKAWGNIIAVKSSEKVTDNEIINAYLKDTNLLSRSRRLVRKAASKARRVMVRCLRFKR